MANDDYYSRHRKEIDTAAAVRKNKANLEKAREDAFKEVPETSKSPTVTVAPKNQVEDRRYTRPFYDRLSEAAQKVLPSGILPKVIKPPIDKE
jgi:hypothetical protein